MNETPYNGRAMTRLVRAGQDRSPHKETSEALFLTSGFVYDTAEEARARFAKEAPGYAYTRNANPTIAQFEARLAAYEGAPAARATPTGMSAVMTALMSGVRAGDHVVAARALFGSCAWIIETLLPRFGVETSLVDGPDLDAWAAAMRSNTKAVFFETPSNPMLEVIDIRAVSALAREAGARVIVDNVFATPALQRPLDLGADVVVYSATKHIDGQGRVMGGAVLGADVFIGADVYDFTRHTGQTLSPFNAWVLTKGLETLELRVERMAHNAARVADALADSPKVERVFYPGRADHPQHAIAAEQMASGGTLVAVELKGGRDAAFGFLDALNLVDISNNLGDAKSLATHPATTTHKDLSEDARAALGISPSAVRLSIGLEDERDLLDDIAKALDAV
ncbi:MAG: O-succinylhomoserine sulfhydrylase [Maricaulaceae bacterium]